MPDKLQKSEEEWKRELPPLSYEVTRNKATEAPFTGKYNKHYEAGMYRCIACGNALFTSETKFDSGSGWPSFWAPAADENVGTQVDRSHGMTRTEVHCSRCGAHLGHIFEDGPAPTHLRYCINSAALDFEQAKKAGE